MVFMEKELEEDIYIESGILCNHNISTTNILLLYMSNTHAQI